MARKRRWIQRAIKKPGSLETFFALKLGIPKRARIPTKLLKKIVSAKAGQRVVLTYRGRRAKVTVTPTLERRAILALTLRKLAKRKKKKRRKKKRRR